MLEIKKEELNEVMEEVERFMYSNIILEDNEEVGFTLFDEGDVEFYIFTTEYVNDNKLNYKDILFSYDFNKNSGELFSVLGLLSPRAIKHLEKSLIAISKGLI